MRVMWRWQMRYFTCHICSGLSCAHHIMIWPEQRCLRATTLKLGRWLTTGMWLVPQASTSGANGRPVESSWDFSLMSYNVLAAELVSINLHAMLCLPRCFKHAPGMSRGRFSFDAARPCSVILCMGAGTLRGALRLSNA